MKVSESWLRELVNPAEDAAQIGHLLTMAGLELDGIEPAAAEFSGVVTGHIVDIAPHPDADKLQVCQVDIGADDNVQIVCGAKNARKDLRVAVATVGARLPGDFKIKKAKLRGVQSLGMICSESELGLADESEGIMELPLDTVTGQDIREFLNLNDNILEIDLTPNRADCLSILGIARELALLTNQPFSEPTFDAVAATIDDAQAVALGAPKACSSYVGRVIRGVKVTADSPLWLQEKLRRAGIRSLGPIVDVTNLVLMELGQPMHAFDLAKLNGVVESRYAASGESLELLDGKTIKLDTETLVIADDSGPIALAGVMGGLATSVTDDCQDIFLEAAFFKPEVIAGKARSYGLHTDSSHRFERGVDFAGQSRAMEYATQLILELCGGDAGPTQSLVDSECLPQTATIQLRENQIERLLGVTLAKDDIERILTGLGTEITANSEGWTVVAPSYRFDLAREVDLLEEIARIYGYDNIPTRARSWAPAIERRPEDQVSLMTLKQRLVQAGFQEVVTYSFVDPKLESVLAPSHKPKALKNPISSDLAVMRSTLWGGLLNTVNYNLRRQLSSLRFFESGLVFINEGKELQQIPKVAGCLTGKLGADQWCEKERDVDFFDIKGDIETMLNSLVKTAAVEWRAATHPALHPGQAAELLVAGSSVGLVGQLHPQAQKALDVSQVVYLFEFDQEALLKAAVPSFSELSRYPSVKRDIALIVDESVTYSQISKCITDLDQPLISDFTAFDVYKGEGVTKGRKSVALSLILQHFSRTLSVEEVEQTIALVLEKLEADIGATLRE